MLWVAGGLGIVATVLAAVLPLLVGVWQAQFQVHADRAGYIASTELFSQVLGTGVFVLVARTWSWRKCATVGLLVMVVGNVASAASATWGSLIAARAIAGLGGGGVRALCMTCLARAASPGLAFSIYAAAQVALAASVTTFLPTFIRAVGPHQPFLALSAIAAAGLLVTPLLPTLVSNADGRRRERQPLSRAALWAIGALFIYFVAQGALWTYLQPIGTQHSIPQPDIVRTLSLLNVAGLIGALGVGALAHRMKPFAAVLTLLGISIVSIIALSNAHAPGVFLVSACGFYFAWCASFPFQFAIISRTDGTGVASAAVPAVDGLGLACGAAVAGVCIPNFGVGVTGWICGVGSAVAVACYGRGIVCARQRAKHRPDSLEAIQE